MIEKISITDPSIVEEVRKNMAVATVNDKGLMPADGFLQGKHINIDNYNNMIKAGTYSHTENIGSGIQTGLLLVFRGQQYSAHIDIGNFSNVYIKTLRSTGEVLNDWRSITIT